MVHGAWCLVHGVFPMIVWPHDADGFLYFRRARWHHGLAADVLPLCTGSHAGVVACQLSAACCPAEPVVLPSLLPWGCDLACSATTLGWHVVPPVPVNMMLSSLYCPLLHCPGVALCYSPSSGCFVGRWIISLVCDLGTLRRASRDVHLLLLFPSLCLLPH